jgi:hypothetical protein
VARALRATARVPPACRRSRPEWSGGGARGWLMWLKCWVAGDAAQREAAAADAVGLGRTPWGWRGRQVNPRRRCLPRQRRAGRPGSEREPPCRRNGSLAFSPPHPPGRARQPMPGRWLVAVRAPGSGQRPTPRYRHGVGGHPVHRACRSTCSAQYLRRPAYRDLRARRIGRRAQSHRPRRNWANVSGHGISSLWGCLGLVSATP